MTTPEQKIATLKRAWDDALAEVNAIVDDQTARWARATSGEREAIKAEQVDPDGAYMVAQRACRTAREAYLDAVPEARVTGSRGSTGERWEDERD